jgi:hypothetical protein
MSSTSPQPAFNPDQFDKVPYTICRVMYTRTVFLLYAWWPSCVVIRYSRFVFTIVYGTLSNWSGLNAGCGEVYAIQFYLTDRLFFPRVLQFSPTIKLTTMFWRIYCWKWPKTLKILNWQQNGASGFWLFYMICVMRIGAVLCKIISDFYFQILQSMTLIFIC